MPRVHANSSLRNRNRVTNKTRLRIIHGNIEADPLIYGEDETPTGTGSIFLSTHGVDAEDANEHHLQAVLSAASQRHQSNSFRSIRGASEKSNVPAVFIPVPDSTGVVDHYEELYHQGRWKDPATYTRSSETVEESTSSALANGFSYYMDERDKEWLDKSNEEARGEGTSAQGAFSTPGTSTRSGPARSAKAKGKEPEVPQPIAISEDEFELVMGLFEKVTHEKTEFLHHSLETGMAFPAFSEYQDTFSSSLPPTTFAAFSVPSWIPSPSNLSRIARVVYPYWKERRLERGGHRIIPTLNGDETDTSNESYICFRRREIKAVRKTRASHITYSDKLVRLQSELAMSLELSKLVLARETLKKEYGPQAQNVWEKRLNVVELKRKFPTLGDKADEELLQDKERVPKAPKVEGLSRLPGLKLRPRDSGPNSPSLYAETVIRPRERRATIHTHIERELQLQKERDHQWEDQIDNMYQQLPVPYPSRLYKWIPPPEARPSVSSSHAKESPRIVQPRAVRLRLGRGGRLLVDRRNINLRSSSFKHPGHSPSSTLDHKQVVDDGDEEERDRTLLERWRFDVDDYPPVGPEGSDEQDRVLIDDYEPKYLRHTMTLLQDSDQANLVTDPSLITTSADGRQQPVIPFKLNQQPVIRRDTLGRLGPSGHPAQTPLVTQHGSTPVPVPPASGTPMSVPTQMKRMQPPTALPQMRISSNGGMRSTVLASNMVPNVSSLQNPHNIVQQVNGVNGVHRTGITAPQHEVLKAETNTISSIPNGADLHPTADVNGTGQSISPVRPKSQNQHHINGYHLTAMNGYPTMSNGSQYLHHSSAQHNGLSIQQMQNLKSTFAAIPTAQDVNSIQANGARQIAGSYLGHVVPNGTSFDMQLGAGANMILKLPSTRQMQWATPPLQQRPTTVNGVDSSATMNGSMSPSPNHTHTLSVGPPVRTPSANGSRAGIRGLPSSMMGSGPGGQLGSHAMSPHLQHSSPSPLPLALSQVQNQPSPPRLPQTPTMAMVSPSLQHQQPVRSSQSGY